MQQQVKIINFKANNFGVFKALELDFEQFKNGIIAIKGNAGAGKSTIQNGVKLSTQGRGVLSDADQYGEAWETETQLIDGERKIFVGAKKVAGKSIEYKLYEKDADGKKVMTPIIDGVKATPAKYMEVISTELTFGIKEFLSEDNTTHKKFMFKLFKPELEKLGVIFDKKHPDYKTSILGQLDELTENRDILRSQCQHSGAFMSDFERDGWKDDSLSILELKDLSLLEQKKNNLLIEKGKNDGDGNAEYEKARSAKAAEGQQVVEDIRKVKERLENAYALELGKFEGEKLDISVIGNEAIQIMESLKVAWLSGYVKKDIWDMVLVELTNSSSELNCTQPIKPICPEINDGKLSVNKRLVYQPEFLPLIEKYKKIASEYSAITPEQFKQSRDFDAEIAIVESEILKVKSNNDLVNRYKLNREWVEACAKVDIKRGELAKLYTKIDTGVDGLRMKPFFDDESGKFDIKTIYTGNYSPEFFRNDGTDERLFVSYSSTQRPIIGILLQVARLKKKAKALPYIFLDDVPMDRASLSLISKIAEENNLTIITSITGDFDKNKLTNNELLIEGGEVFFNKIQ